jgi:23S rRNA pseudouridine1911/1915/1917 synthase
VQRLRFDVAEDAAGERLDRYLAAQVPELSRARVQRLIRDGEVAVDGEVAGKPSEPVAPGQRVDLVLRSRTPDQSVEPEDIPLSVLHEDDDIAVIDKPAGMVTHPAPGHDTGTLVHALLHRYGSRLRAFSDSARPGIVHRLDRGTSGVIVVALNDQAHAALAAQFAERTVSKEYLAVVYGTPDAAAGTVDAPIGRDPGDRKRMSTRARRAREAVTDWELEEPLAGFALLRARPRTGRTHQIRVHLAHLHHPIVGDADYAGRQWRGVPEGRIRSMVRDFPRPALHAHRLQFEHPSTGQRIGFEAAPPADFESLLSVLRSWRDRG